jgi:hypothetical protein
VVVYQTRIVGTAIVQGVVIEYASAKKLRRKYDADITSADVCIHH